MVNIPASCRGTGCEARFGPQVGLLASVTDSEGIVSQSPHLTEGQLRSLWMVEDGACVPTAWPESRSIFFFIAPQRPLLLAVMVAFSGRRSGLLVEIPLSHREYNWHEIVIYPKLGLKKKKKDGHGIEKPYSFQQLELCSRQSKTTHWNK